MKKERERFSSSDMEYDIVKSIHKLSGEYLEAYDGLKEGIDKRERHYELLKRLDLYINESDNKDEEIEKNKKMVLESILDIIKNVKENQVKLKNARSKLIKKGLLNEMSFQSKKRTIHEELKETHEHIEEVYTRYDNFKKSLKKLFDTKEN